MMTPKGKIYVKGKRISPSKVNAMIYKAVENITMAGFTSPEQLYHMVMTNSNDNKAIANYVLVNMLEDYLCTMSRECERMFFQEDRKSSTFNAMLHNQNISIINEVIGMIIGSNMPSDMLYDEDEEDDDILDLNGDDVLNILPLNNTAPLKVKEN